MMDAVKSETTKNFAVITKVLLFVGQLNKVLSKSLPKIFTWSYTVQCKKNPAILETSKITMILQCTLS